MSHQRNEFLFIIFILFIGVTFTSPICKCGRETTLPELARKLKPSVVSLEIFSSSGPSSFIFLLKRVSTNSSLGSLVSQGSGFFVGPGLVLAARHLFSNSETFSGLAKTNVKTPEEFEIESVLADDLEADLILLRVHSQNGSGLTVATELPEEGEDIFVISSPARLPGVITDGIVSVLHNDIDMQITAHISEGSSGGPVFNYKGEVVGMVRGFLTNGQNLNFAVTPTYISKFLAEGISMKGISGDPNSCLFPTLREWSDRKFPLKKNFLRSIFSELKNYTKAVWQAGPPKDGRVSKRRKAKKRKCSETGYNSA